jgi:hypothetical protein
MCHFGKVARFGAQSVRRIAEFLAILRGKVLAPGAIPRALCASLALVLPRS